MFVFVLGLAIFFAVHMVPIIAPDIKAFLISKAGKKIWMLIYSVASLGGFMLIVFGWGQYRPVAPTLYEPFSWGRDVTMTLVWVAFILFAVPRKKPGRIMVFVKHPMVTGVIFWSIGHLFANGDLASVMLFGSFLVYALISRVTKISPNAPIPEYVSPRGDIIAIGGGTVFYAVFVVWIHFWLFGISPF